MRCGLLMATCQQFEASCAAALKKPVAAVWMDSGSLYIHRKHDRQYKNSSY